MDKTKAVKRSVKQQSNDKKSISFCSSTDQKLDDINLEIKQQEIRTYNVVNLKTKSAIKTQSNSNDLSNHTSIDQTNDDTIEKKLDKFIAKVKDDDIRENCFKNLDDHVNNLLDTVKIREKKRKNAKPESNCLDKIDLTTSDSILTQINLKNVFNMNTFTSLPLYYQYKLIKLLPKCDQEITSSGWLNLNSSALNNEYFTKAYKYWLKQLKENKLNSDFIQKCKADLERERQKLDPFKVINFEPVWNESLPSKENFNKILDQEYQNKLNLKVAKEEEIKNRDELNKKLTSFEFNSNNQTKVIQSTKQNKKRTPKPNNHRTSSINKTNQMQTPIKDNSHQITNLNLQNVSPLPSIGSITIKKTLQNSSSPSIIQSTTNDLSSPNNKIFYISQNGKLLQIQQTILPQNLQFEITPRLSTTPTKQLFTNDNSITQSNQIELVNGRKRKIDSDNAIVNNLNDLKPQIIHSISNNEQSNDVQHHNLIVPNSSINQSVVHYNLSNAVSSVIQNNNNQNHVNSFLRAACQCQHRPFVNCIQCKAFYHAECLNDLKICDNCLQTNSNLVVN